jgi:hypothetical protein
MTSASRKTSMKAVGALLLGLFATGLPACGAETPADDPVASEASLEATGAFREIDARDSGKDLTMERGSRLRISLRSPSANHRWTVFLVPGSLTEPLAKFDHTERMKTFRWTISDDAPLDAPADKLLLTPERKVGSEWEIDWSNVFYVKLRYARATGPRPTDIVLGRNDDGATVRARPGQDIVVRLDQANIADAGWLVVERGELGWAYFTRLSPERVEYRWETDQLTAGFSSGTVRFGYATSGSVLPGTSMRFSVVIP